MTSSHYYVGEITGSQQPFSDKDGHLHCRSMEEKYDYSNFPECNHAQESHTCQYLLFLAMFTVCRDPAVVMDPEILLPWQRETTSHLCISIEVSYCQWPLIKMVTFLSVKNKL